MEICSNHTNQQSADCLVNQFVRLAYLHSGGVWEKWGHFVEGLFNLPAQKNLLTRP